MARVRLAAPGDQTARYRAKYRRYVDPMTSPQARAATVKFMPRI